MENQRRTTISALLIPAIIGAALTADAHGPQVGPKAPNTRTEVGATSGAWQAEPDSFMGFKFGKRMDEQVQECPKKAKPIGITYYDYDESRISGENLRCFKKLAAHLYEIQNPPAIGLWIGKVTALVADEKFEGISFIFQHSDADRMADLFKARYGSPTNVKRQTLQTGGGATIAGNEYTWSGGNVTILLSEYASRIDEGDVRIATKTYEESRARTKKESTDRYKDKL